MNDLIVPPVALVALIACIVSGCGGERAGSSEVEIPEVSVADQTGSVAEEAGSAPDEPVSACVEAACATEMENCCAEHMEVWTWSHRCKWCCRSFGSSCAEADGEDGWERGARALCCWNTPPSHDFGYCGPEGRCCLPAGERACYLTDRFDESCGPDICCSGTWDAATRHCQ